MKTYEDALARALSGVLAGTPNAHVAARRALDEYQEKVDAAQDDVEYVAGLPLVRALWWFIENIEAEHSRRNEIFFALRERVREANRNG